jgi:ribonuclease E
MLINALDPEESRIAVVEDGVLQELHVELANREAYLGNIYKGRVVNVEPSIGAAFVAFGGRVNGFLHVSDVLPAYGKPDFVLDDVVEGRARLADDDGPESVQQALADDDDAEEEEGPGGGLEPAPAADAGVEQVGEESRADGPIDPAERHEQEPSGQQRPRRDSTDAARAGDDHDDEPRNGPQRGDPAADAGSVDPADERPLAMAAGPSGTDDPEDEGPVGFDDPPSRVQPPAEQTGTEPRSARARETNSRGERGPSRDHDRGVDADRDAGQGGGEEPRPEPAGSVGVGSVGFTTEPRDGEPRNEAWDTGSMATGPKASGPEVRDEVGAARPRRDRRRGRGRDRGDRGDERAQDRGPDAQDRPGERDGDRRPRRPRPTIDQLLRKGQEVVVQVTKEGIGTKGPTLTSYVSLPGRSLVLMPSLPKCGVSRKIADGKERKRLKRIVRELDETGHGGIGFIVRTAGVNKSLADLERDRDYLKKIWEMIGARLKQTRAPALLYQESDLVLKAMRDQFTPDIAEVVCDSEDVFMRIKDFAEKLMPHMAERIRLHALTTPLFHSFGIETAVEALYQPKVDLPNGATIVIDQTEALVAIDVNSGKYKPGADLDETAYRTNLDAIPEIVRQLRLRDLGGLIIIDFIDMAHEKHRRGVERRLIEALRGDRARIKVGRISPFGMLEITRQRVGPGLKRTVFMQCPHCKGAGWSRTVQSKALSVLREVRALLHLKGYSLLQVFASPTVTDYLANYKRRSVLDLEEAVGKAVVFRPELSYPIDVVHYRFLTGDGQEARIAIPAGLGVKA